MTMTDTRTDNGQLREAPTLTTTVPSCSWRRGQREQYRDLRFDETRLVMRVDVSRIAHRATELVKPVGEDG